MESNEKIIIDKKDYSISGLNDLVNDGDLILTPDYQREYVYDNKKASYLIESVLIGIPIPIVYFSEEDDGSYEVIDGQQRITTLINFLTNKLCLTSLKKLEHYNGKYFKDLDKPTQRYFKGSTLSIIVIRKQSKELKYDIFERLNQGAVSLKPQEIRNCIYRGNFNVMLKETSKKYNLLLYKMFRKENTRMQYEELILHYFTYRSFFYTNNPRTCSPTIMNKYMEQQNNLSIEDINPLMNDFIKILKAVEQVLGEDAFFSYKSSDKIGRFVAAIYDSIMIAFNEFDRNTLIKYADDIREKINNIKMNDECYYGYIRNNVNNSKHIRGRVNIIINAIKSVVPERNESQPRLFSFEIKQQLFNKEKKCAICGQEILSIDDCEVDHIIPFSNGGTTTIDNAQLAHRYCNRIKNNK